MKKTHCIFPPSRSLLYYLYLFTEQLKMRRYFEIILLMTADSLRYQKVSVILKSVIHTSDRKHNFYDSPYLLYYADPSITEIKKQNI